MPKVYHAYFIRRKDFMERLNEFQNRKDELADVFTICTMHLVACVEIGKTEDPIGCVFSNCENTFAENKMPQAVIVLMPVQHEDNDDVIVAAICDECLQRKDFADVLIHYFTELMKSDDIVFQPGKEFQIVTEAKPTRH
jgi:hypothetical protein